MLTATTNSHSCHFVLGYYADPENCRWFFACLDHGRSPLSAYEFRCPYGLVFDQDRLVCEWSWLVPRCASGYATGGGIVGAQGYQAHGSSALVRYDGLGALGVVKLGGLRGGFAQPTKVYSTLGQSQGLEVNHNQLGLGAFGKFGSESGFNQNNFRGGIASDSQTLSHQDAQYAGGFSQYGGKSFFQNYHNDLGGGKYYQPVTFGSLNSNLQGDAGYRNTEYYGKTGYKHNGGYYFGQVNSEGGAGGILGVASLPHLDVNKNFEYNQQSKVRENLGVVNVAGVQGGFEYNQQAQLGDNSGIIHVTPHPNIEYAYNQQAKAGGNLKVINVTPVPTLDEERGFEYNQQTGLGGNLGVVRVTPLPTAEVQDGVQYDQHHRYNSPHSVDTNGQQDKLFRQNNVASVSPFPTQVLAYQQDNRYHGATFASKEYQDYQFAQQINKAFGGANVPTVDVVAGGISGVGHSGIYQHGTVVEHVTPIPSITISPPLPTPLVPAAPVPVVTSTPTYEGGVVANVQQLQFKVVAPSVTSYSEFNENLRNGFNFSQGFNHISSTLQPPLLPVVGPHQSYAANEGYSYSKPVVAFHEGDFQKVSLANSFNYQPVTTPSYPVSVPIQPVLHVTPTAPVVAYKGYQYPKPAVKFVEKPQLIVKVTPPPLAHILQHEVIRPAVAVTPPSPVVQPIYKVTSPAPPLVVQHEVAHPPPRVQFVPPTPSPPSQIIHHEVLQPVVKVTPSPSPHIVQPIVKVTPPPLVQVVQPEIVQPIVRVTSPTPPIYEVKNPPAVRITSPQPLAPVTISPPVTAPRFVHPVIPVTPVPQFNVQKVVQITPPPQTIILQPQNPSVISSFDIHNEPAPIRKLQPLPQLPKAVQPNVISTFSFQNSSNIYDFNRYNYESHSIYPQPILPYTYHDHGGYHRYVEHVPQSVISSFSFGTGVKENQKAFALPVAQYPVVRQRLEPVQPLYTTPRPQLFQPIRLATPATPLVEQEPLIQVTPKPETFLVAPSPQPAIRFQEKLQPVVQQQAFRHNQGYNQQFIVHDNEVRLQPVVQATPKVQPVIQVTSAIPILQKENVQTLVQPLQPQTFEHTQRFNHQFGIENHGVRFQEHIQPVVQVAPKIQLTATVPILQKEIVQPLKPQTFQHTQHFNQKFGVQEDGLRLQENIQPVVQVTTAIPVTPKQIVQPQIFQHTQSYNQQFAIGDYGVGFEEHVQPVIQVTPKVQSLVQVTTAVPNIVQPQAFQNTQSYNQQFAIEDHGVRFQENIQPVVRVTTAAPVVQHHRQENIQHFAVQNNADSFLENVQPVSVDIASKVRTTPLAVVQKNIVQPRPVYVENFEVRQPVPFVATNAYTEHKYSKNSAQKTVEEYTLSQNPIVVQPQGYYYPKPVQEPPFVKKTAYVTGNRPKPVIIESYSQVVTTPRPDGYRKQVYISTPAPFTPKPTFHSTIASVVDAKSAERQGHYYYYDSRVHSTASTVQPPKQDYLPPPTTTRYYIPPRTTSLPLPPPKEYLPSTTAPPRIYLPSTTTLPPNEYLPPTKAPPPPRVYLPSTTALPPPPSDYLPPTPPPRVYLPSTTVHPPPTEYLPSTTYLPPKVKDKYVRTRVRPQTKTYVRVNDFHPLLPAKLGAQCTCTSNTVELRRKPVTSVNRIVVEDDDDYVVEPNPVNVGGRVVENYVNKNYDIGVQKVIEATSVTPLALPTDAPTSPSPTYVVRKRVRVRPVTNPTTVYVSEVTTPQQLFLKKSKSVTVVDSQEDKPVLDAIKSTIKTAVNEALNEHNFDRFGHGGVRSRSDTLQGTIDCQRAGLFRHPQECNKFYACRWDCTKKRFTLHVFNCPVHLTFDPNLAACNWPSQGPACTGNTLLPNSV